MSFFEKYLPDPEINIPTDIAGEGAPDLTIGYLHSGVEMILDQIGAEAIQVDLEQIQTLEDLPVTNPYLPVSREKADKFVMERFRLEPVYDVPTLESVPTPKNRDRFLRIKGKLKKPSERFPYAERMTLMAFNQLKMFVTSIIDVMTFVPGRAPTLARALAQMRRGEAFCPIDPVVFRVFLVDFINQIVSSVSTICKSHTVPSEIEASFGQDLETNILPEAIPNFFMKLFADEFVTLDQSVIEAEVNPLVAACFQGRSFQSIFEEAKNVPGQQELDYENVRNFPDVLLSALRGVDRYTKIYYDSVGSSPEGLRKTSQRVLAMRKQYSALFYEHPHLQAKTFSDAQGESASDPFAFNPFLPVGTQDDGQPRYLIEKPRLEKCREMEFRNEAPPSSPSDQLRVIGDSLKIYEKSFPEASKLMISTLTDFGELCACILDVVFQDPERAPVLFARLQAVPRVLDANLIRSFGNRFLLAVQNTIALSQQRSGAYSASENLATIEEGVIPTAVCDLFEAFTGVMGDNDMRSELNRMVSQWYDAVSLPDYFGIQNQELSEMAINDVLVEVLVVEPIKSAFQGVDPIAKSFSRVIQVPSLEFRDPMVQQEVAKVRQTRSGFFYRDNRGDEAPDEVSETTGVSHSNPFVPASFGDDGEPQYRLEELRVRSPRRFLLLENADTPQTSSRTLSHVVDRVWALKDLCPERTGVLMVSLNEFADICACIIDVAWHDPQRFPQLAQAIEAFGTSCDLVPLREFADRFLERAVGMIGQPKKRIKSRGLKLILERIQFQLIPEAACDLMQQLFGISGLDSREQILSMVQQWHNSFSLQQRFEYLWEAESGFALGQQEIRRKFIDPILNALSGLDPIARKYDQDARSAQSASHLPEGERLPHFLRQFRTDRTEFFFRDNRGDEASEEAPSTSFYKLDIVLPTDADKAALRERFQELVGDVHQTWEDAFHPFMSAVISVVADDIRATLVRPETVGVIKCELPEGFSGGASLMTSRFFHTFSFALSRCISLTHLNSPTSDHLRLILGVLRADQEYRRALMSFLGDGHTGGEGCCGRMDANAFADLVSVYWGGGGVKREQWAERFFDLCKIEFDSILECFQEDEFRSRLNPPASAPVLASAPAPAPEPELSEDERPGDATFDFRVKAELRLLLRAVKFYPDEEHEGEFQASVDEALEEFRPACLEYLGTRGSFSCMGQVKECLAHLRSDAFLQAFPEGTHEVLKVCVTGAEESLLTSTPLLHRGAFVPDSNDDGWKSPFYVEQPRLKVLYDRLPFVGEPDSKVLEGQMDAVIQSVRLLRMQYRHFEGVFDACIAHFGLLCACIIDLVTNDGDRRSPQLARRIRDLQSEKGSIDHLEGVKVFVEFGEELTAIADQSKLGSTKVRSRLRFLENVQRRVCHHVQRFFDYLVVRMKRPGLRLRRWSVIGIDVNHLLLSLMLN